MAVCGSCDARDGERIRSRELSRTGLARVCGDLRLSGGWVGRRRCRQAGSGMARSRAKARLNFSAQGQRSGRCRVNRRAERVSRPAREKNRRRRVLVVAIRSPRPIRAVQRARLWAIVWTASHGGDGEPIPTPSAPLPGEHLVAVPADMAAPSKAAFALAFRGSGLTRVALAQRLGTDEKSVRRMLNPRHGTTPSHINRALRVLGSELVVEVREIVAV